MTNFLLFFYFLTATTHFDHFPPRLAISSQVRSEFNFIFPNWGYSKIFLNLASSALVLLSLRMICNTKHSMLCNILPISDCSKLSAKYLLMSMEMVLKALKCSSSAHWSRWWFLRVCHHVKPFSQAGMHFCPFVAEDYRQVSDWRPTCPNRTWSRL